MTSRSQSKIEMRKIPKAHLTCGCYSLPPPTNPNTVLMSLKLRYVGVQESPHKPLELGSLPDRDSLLSKHPQDWSTRALIQILELNHDNKLRSYKAFKPQIHEHLCQVVLPIKIQGQGNFLRNMPLLYIYPASIDLCTQLGQKTGLF